MKFCNPVLDFSNFTSIIDDNDENDDDVGDIVHLFEEESDLDDIVEDVNTNDSQACDKERKQITASNKKLGPGDEKIIMSYTRLQAYMDLFYCAWNSVRSEILDKVNKLVTQSNMTLYLVQFFEELNLCVEPFIEWWKNGNTISFWNNPHKMIGLVDYCKRQRFQNTFFILQPICSIYWKTGLT